MLEALILDISTWEDVPLTKRKTMSSNESSAILLWSEPCQWYSPLPEYKLPTAPGILRLTLDVPPPPNSNTGTSPNPVWGEWAGIEWSTPEKTCRTTEKIPS